MVSQLSQSVVYFGIQLLSECLEVSALSLLPR